MLSGHSIFDAPDVVHHFSYATGVSFELPARFETAGEDDHAVGYVDEEDPPTRLQVRRVGEVTSGAADEAAAKLADGFAAQPGELRQRREFVVDDAPAHTVVVRRPDGMLLHQTALAHGAALLSVVAIFPEARGETLLPELDRALESVRLIDL